MATYVVGDIQGCYEELQRLLETIRFDPSTDELWSCGDLVNRGGGSLQTLRLLQSLGDRFKSVLGNHDLFLLRENWRCPDGASSNHEMAEILKAPDRESLMTWLQAWPLAHFSEAHQLMLVHAGVIPQWSVAETLAHAAEVESRLRSHKAGKFFAKMRKNAPRRWDPALRGWRRRRLISDILTRIRFCDKNGKVVNKPSGPPGSAKKPYKAWFKHKTRLSRDTTIVFGHWSSLGLYNKKNVVCLDTGCVWGGQLTTLRLEDRELFQVQGRKRRL